MHFFQPHDLAAASLYLSPDLPHDADKTLTKMFFPFSFQGSFEMCT